MGSRPDAGCRSGGRKLASQQLRKRASEEQAQADDASEKDGVEADAGGGAREPAGGGLDERQKIAEAIADAAEAALTQMEQSNP